MGLKRLQVTVMAAGGKCRVSPNGPHIGIAHDVELTEEGRRHKIYSSKAKSILNSIEKTLSVKENRTIDLHGSSNTVQCAKAVLSNIN